MKSVLTLVRYSGLAVLSALAGCSRHTSHQPALSDSAKVSELSVTDPVFQDRLLEGFYDGTTGWKWTARRFSVALDAPPPLDAPTSLKLNFAVPAELIRAVNPVKVTAKVNGSTVGRQTFKSDGHQLLSYPVASDLLKKNNPAVVEVALDRWGTDPSNNRDIGLIVVSVSLTHPDNTELGHDDATEEARREYEHMLKLRELKVPEERQKEMMKLFHDVPVWANMWFQNVKIEKNPLDLWMYQQIIYETRPEFIVETGTLYGGSALYWAHTLNGMGLENSRVITVDIDDQVSGSARQNPLWKKYVTFFKGSSTDPAIVAEIARRASGHKTLVTLDSDHSAKHVLNELKAYSPMVSRGSYLVVEDTHIDGVPTNPAVGPGPLTAVLQFLKEGGSNDFQQDFSREAFIMTFNPGGWLRRK